MRCVDLEELAEDPEKVVLETLKTKGEIVMTSKGKPVAILQRTDEDTFEETVAVISGAPAVKAVDGLQTKAGRIGKDRITEEEIEREIRAARRERKGDRTP